MGRQAHMIATAGSVMFQIIGLIAVSASSAISKLESEAIANDLQVKSCVTFLKLGTRMMLMMTPLRIISLILAISAQTSYINPRRKTPQTAIFCFLGSLRPKTMYIGKTKIVESMMALKIPNSSPEKRAESHRF